MTANRSPLVLSIFILHGTVCVA